MPANHLFDAIRAAAPDGTATCIERHGGVLTYDDVLTGSARLANALQAAGVRAGDRVAAQVDKSAEALLLYLASVRAGAAFLPLNPAYTAAELEYFIGDAEPSLVVCDPRRRDVVAAVARGATVDTLAAAGCGTLMDRATSMPADFDDQNRGPEDLAAILYTSGTTGRSKGAMLTHHNLLSNARTLADHWRFTSDDVLLHVLPIFHTHGLFVATNVVLLAAASMVLQPKFDLDGVFEAMPRCTTMMGVPTFYVRLLQDERLTRDSTRHMRLFISGSAPLLSATHEAWHARTGHTILERYGMTETNMNTSNPYDGDRIAGTVGLPLPGVQLRIVDEAGALVAPGSIGTIQVKGPNVFAGYWRNPAKTAEELGDDGWFITGDLGTMDERGYVRIVGRGKDLIISGGLNVYPKEIEDEIDALPGVMESAVIGVPHSDFGEGVTAVVVAGPELDEQSVQSALAVRLAAFKLPKRVIVVDELPRNAMGKVQKSVLRDTYQDLYR